MKFYLEYIVVRTFIAILQLFPITLVSRFGAAAGLFAYYFIPIRRSVALTNLRNAFPDRSEKQIRKICRSTYINFGMTFFEYLCVETLSHEEINEMVTFDPPDLLAEIVAQNKGAILTTGHFSSFEFLGISIANRGLPIDVVVKAMRNPRVESIMDRMRAGKNPGIIKMKEEFSRLRQSILKKKVLALVTDQDAGSNGVMIPFLNMETSTYAGPAILVLRTKAPLIGSYIIRKGIAKYTAKVHLVSCENLPKTNKEKIKEVTIRYSSLLESYIRQYPEQYFWMHKRWKSTGVEY